MTANNIYLVEDCRAITTKEALELAHTGRSKNIKSDINCWLENIRNQDILYLSIGGREPQEINIEYRDITFGQTAFFNCSCGCRVSKLFLLPNSSSVSDFKCKKCHSLKYRLSTLNSKSIAGIAIKRMNKINKLVDKREKITRIFYRGKYTAKFNNFLDECRTVGLHDVVNNAKELMEVVNQFQNIKTKAD